MSRVSVAQRLKQLWLHKIVRFACVGAINTTIDLTILNTLVFVFGLKLLVANLISATISIIISYFLNHSIVFLGRHQISLKLFAKFFLVTGLSILAVQSLIIYGFEHVFTINIIRNALGKGSSPHLPRAIQVNGAKLTAVLGGMVWNFVLYHLVVFKEANIIEDEPVVPN